uniref:Oxysterol-binding protein n=1 Tax=Hirondellea gigas TaxID=1518452 RepID=A0A2P2I3H7_9CRUS
MSLSTPPSSVSATGATDNGSLSRAESYKDQRRKYRREKKRVARELLSTLKDPSVVVLADWLKVRGTLKGWTKLWCVLKPGMLLLYKSAKAKSSHWCGTVLLNTCELIERPSKKDGFCFKLFHPLEQSIWATKGPQGETIGAVVQPLPSSHLIFRAPSQAAGKCWMDAMELAVRCSSLLLRSMPASPGSQYDATDSSHISADDWNEADIEKHFMDQDLDDASHTDENQRSSGGHYSDTDSDDAHTLADNTSTSASTAAAAAKQLQSRPNRARRRQQQRTSTASNDSHRQVQGNSSVSSEQQGDEEEEEQEVDEEEEENMNEEEDEEEEEEEEEEVIETSYVINTEDFICENWSGGQQEELAEENKSLLWCLVKQVRPGMDLSKVVLPTFILEPRSFLDKLADYYYHADVLSTAVLDDDPFNRMKEVVRWYLSGFYKKPKGLKKPYNPILGETFRCYWKHPNGSRTFYVAEQVSHHPPVSALYVINRQQGFALSATVLAKSKFYGNSTSAILDGCVRLMMLPRGEEYTMSMPYAHCKGILMGTLSMELGGKVNIDCEKTGYSTEIEFKLKPFLSGYDAHNVIGGRLRLGKETLATVQGHWDTGVTITSKKTGETEQLWTVSQAVKERRLPRYTVVPEQLGPTESERLWQHVSRAIAKDDQVAATEEKSILEEMQRSDARERKAKCEDWMPKYFRQDHVSGAYVYNYSDLRPWDQRTDLYQYEHDYVVSTKTRHKHLKDGRPASLTASLISMDAKCGEGVGRGCVGEGIRLRGVSEGGETSSGEQEDARLVAAAVGAGITAAENNVASLLKKSLVQIESSQTQLLTEVQGMRQQVESVNRRLQTMAETPSAQLSWKSLLVLLLLSVVCQMIWSRLTRPPTAF